MDHNGFAYVLRGGLLLVLVMATWHGGNAMLGLLPPIEHFFHNLAKIALILHAIPIVPWIYIQIVDPVVADFTPWLALSPQDALRIEERTGRYGSFFLLPYPKLIFGIFVKVFQSVIKFLYDVAFDFEETVLNNPLVYQHTVRLRNYIRSKLGQDLMPANRKRLRYTNSSTSTTITQADIHRACMKPRHVCEDNLLLLRNAENERSLVIRTRENEQEAERRVMEQQIASLQATVQRHSRWDYSLMYRDERRHHNETREQLESIREQLESSQEQLEGTQNSLEALQDESNMNHEIVEEERRRNATLATELEAANAITSNDSTRIQNLEQELSRLNLLANNQRIQIESNQRELDQHVANEIQMLGQSIIIPAHIKAVLEEIFDATIEEKKQQIHSELSQKLEEDLQAHKARLEHEHSRNQLQSFVDETANIESEKQRIQAECENERQLIELEKQDIKRAQDIITRDRQAIEQEKNRIDVERNHQFQLIEQEKKAIQSDRHRIHTELENERRLIEQEKDSVQSDRAQFDRDSQTQRQVTNQGEQRMLEERRQIQSDSKKLQDERLRLEQDQKYIQSKMSEVSQTEHNTNAATEEKRRIAELEDEVEQYEKLLHLEKSKDKTAFSEHQKLKDDFARMEAENQMLKARLSGEVATPSESRVGVMSLSAAPAAPTQPESTQDTSAALTTPMDVTDMGETPAVVANNEEDPIFKEMLQGVNAALERERLENKAKEITKNFQFTFAPTVEENIHKTRKVLQPRSLKTRMGNMYGTTTHETSGPSSQAPNDESTRPKTARKEPRTARKEPVASGQVADKRPRPTTARKEPYTLPSIDPVSEEDEDEDDDENQETENEYEEEVAFIEDSE